MNILKSVYQGKFRSKISSIRILKNHAHARPYVEYLCSSRARAASFVKHLLFQQGGQSPRPRGVPRFASVNCKPVGRSACATLIRLGKLILGAMEKSRPAPIGHGIESLLLVQFFVIGESSLLTEGATWVAPD